MGISFIRVIVTGRSIGVRFKSNGTFNFSYADSIRLSIEGHSRLRVIYA